MISASIQECDRALSNLCRLINERDTEAENAFVKQSARRYGPNGQAMAMHPSDGSGFEYFPESMIGQGALTDDETIRVLAICDQHPECAGCPFYALCDTDEKLDCDSGRMRSGKYSEKSTSNHSGGDQHGTRLRDRCTVHPEVETRVAA